MAPSSPLLSVSATDGPMGLVLAFRGEIDLATESIVTQQVEAALAQRPPSLVLDLGRVTFFGARALSAVIEARQAAVDNGCRLELRSLSPIIKRVIIAGGAAELLAMSPVSDDVLDAV
jgi:anti-anti-sigma factor